MPEINGSYSYASLEEFTEFIHSEEALQQSQWDAREVFVDTKYYGSRLVFATAKINGKLSNRFNIALLTIAKPPPILTQICMRIAHHQGEQNSGEIRQPVERHLELALEDLEALATGAMGLVGADGKPIVVTNPITEPGAIGDTSPSFVGQRGLVLPRIAYGRLPRVY